VRVILTGFRGTGKTRTGELLARLLGIPFVDTDEEVERAAGMPVYEIFARFGEEEFRARECSVIASLPDEGVISTGGGAILDPKNVERLRHRSTVILLTADPVTIERRIGQTERPPLTRLPLREEIVTLLAIRRERYLSSADFCIDTSRKDVNEVALSIEHLLSGGDREPGRVRRALEFIRTGDIPAPEFRELAGYVEGPGADPLTRIYGIAGNPCAHSVSPPLFNRLFARFGLNAHYTRFCGRNLPDILSHARALGCRGLSVTIPFKEAALAAATEHEDHAARIGAANTLVFCGNSIRASNTDWVAIRDLLAHRHDQRAVVLGAGGAAAAAGYALISLGMETAILNRSPERAKILASRLGCLAGSPGDLAELSPDVFVNATPVGMGSGDECPIDVTVLHDGMTILDMVYTPPETALIRAARAAGAEAIPGTKAFVLQARAQFSHFTGIAVTADLVQEVIPV
jgi:shikimate dehydrogenase